MFVQHDVDIFVFNLFEEKNYSNKNRQQKQVYTLIFRDDASLIE